MTSNPLYIEALPNQTRPDGTPSIARTSGTDEASDYALSYLPGQRLSRCTCIDDKTHPGPRHADGSWVGRSAPEIGGSFSLCWISEVAY